MSGGISLWKIHLDITYACACLGPAGRHFWDRYIWDQLAMSGTGWLRLGPGLQTVHRMVCWSVLQGTLARSRCSLAVL